MNEPSSRGANPCDLLVRGLCFTRRGRRILDQVDFDLTPGEVVALLGANGSGKSTLFRLLLALLRPDAGAVHLEGQPVSRWSAREMARRVAYVPQGHVAAFPYTVRDVATLGRIAEEGIFLAPSARDEAIVDDVLARLGLLSLADRPYTEISGGERQLTLIARALAQGARLIILDEPTNGLDFGNQVRLLDHFRDLAAEGHGILFSTHHPEQAVQAATRVAVLDQGRIKIAEKPDQVVTPDLINDIYGLGHAHRSWSSGKNRTAP